MSLTSFSVGQTPRKLFNAPHPQRLNHGLAASLPIGMSYGVEEDPQLLVQESRCFKGTHVNFGLARGIIVTPVFQIWDPLLPSANLY